MAIPRNGDLDVVIRRHLGAENACCEGDDGNEDVGDYGGLIIRKRVLGSLGSGLE